MYHLLVLCQGTVNSKTAMTRWKTSMHFAKQLALLRHFLRKFMNPIDRFSLVPALCMAVMFVSACSDGSSEGQSFVNNESPVLQDQQAAALSIPEYGGELVFQNMMTIDLDTIIEEAGLKRVGARQMARDGQSIIVEAESDSGDVAGILKIDTESGQFAWLIDELSPETRVLFDADNNAVAVLGIGCGMVTFNVLEGPTPTDLSGILNDGECFSARPRVSADGTVALFSSYEQGNGTPYLSATATFHAYTFDTANLVTYPDVSVTIDEITFAPQLIASTFRDSELSNDGTLLFTPQWWEGSNETGGTFRQVGGVLWNTQTGEWQTRARVSDTRNCVATQKVSCLPPYSYVQSTESKILYSQLPDDQEINPGSGPVAVYGSTLETYASTETDKLTEGYTLYSGESDQFVSLNRSLRACPTSDEQGESIAEADCDHTSIPVASTSNPLGFTADGSHALFRIISRFTDDFEQAVDSFILDVDQAAMFSMPENFEADPTAISADGSVFMGMTGYPDYDILIGTR